MSSFKTKTTGERYIKMGDWYVILTPVKENSKKYFIAQYYKNGLKKLQFTVSDTYEVSYSEEKTPEKDAILQKMDECLKTFLTIEALEKKDKKSI